MKVIFFVLFLTTSLIHGQEKWSQEFIDCISGKENLDNYQTFYDPDSETTETQFTKCSDKYGISKKELEIYIPGEEDIIGEVGSSFIALYVDINDEKQFLETDKFHSPDLQFSIREDISLSKLKGGIANICDSCRFVYLERTRLSGDKFWTYAEKVHTRESRAFNNNIFSVKQKQKFLDLYYKCESYGYVGRNAIASCIQKEVLYQQQVAQNNPQSKFNATLDIISGVLDILHDPEWKVKKLENDLKRLEVRQRNMEKKTRRVCRETVKGTVC